MIPVKNIYYMLAYAFQVLNEDGYKSVATEQFNNVADLCSAILCRGVSLQLKKGLGREYISETEMLSGLRGRIDITESIKTQAMLRRQMVCTYDEFSVNTYKNQVIKTTMLKLLHVDIDKKRKKEIKKLLVFFGEVNELDVYSIQWNQQYSKNDQTYRMLIAICYLVTANASQILWIVDDGVKDMLPIMQSDIMLSKENQVLIIDAKYYKNTMQTQFEKQTLHSGNLYQIFTYVKNKEAELEDKQHEVAGMLMYAKTDEDIVPDNKYSMSGNKIYVRTLDLNCDFLTIREQLDSIVANYFD